MQIASLALEALRADGIVVGQTVPRALRLIGVRAEKARPRRRWSATNPLRLHRERGKLTLRQNCLRQNRLSTTRRRGADNSPQNGTRSGAGAHSGSGARLVKSGRWSEVEHVMDAIHRGYSQESLKPASGVTAPEKSIDEKRS